MCEYIFYGYCGILYNYDVDNDEIFEYIVKIVLFYVKVGVDIIVLFDMMDGRIGKIREVLDKNNFKDILIMLYSVKYLFVYYGFFRDVVDLVSSFGDRKIY